jgi:hypothetical protein
MDTTKYIRFFTALELLMFAISMILSSLFESELPVLIQEYIQQESGSGLYLSDSLFILLTAGVLLINVSASIGLIFVQLWAKKVYLYSAIYLFSVTPFYGPVIEHAYAATFSGFSTLLVGSIITLLYFTDSEFHRQ